MTLMPAEVAVCAVNFGPHISFTGNGGAIRARLTVDQPVIHAATGIRLDIGNDTLTAATGQPLQFSVPYVDQTGFVDRQGAAVTEWTYTLAGTVTFGSKHRQRFSRTFQVHITDGATVDLDLTPVDATEVDA